jgi:hypothetical protein
MGGFSEWHVEVSSVLTCPECRHEQLEEMPLNACRYFYECPSCQSMLRPIAGDCCVFCSYGSVKCPSMQLEEIDV